ncbi:MAG: type IV pilus biogenesis protein PilM [Vicinamibacteria bacterium]
MTGPSWRARSAEWLHRRFLAPPAPLAAVEVRARALGAVRLVAQGNGRVLGGAASVELPEGTLRLSISEPNVVNREAFRQGLRSVVEKAGILGAGRVALVLPDPVARVALLPASDVRGRGAEAEEMLRFRLRKAVPFEIRSARLASVPVHVPGREPQILVAAILASVLEEYEGACRGLGLEPGLVELAGLAILDAVEERRRPADRVVVNWDDGYVSIILSRDGAPLLIRTLTGADAGSPTNVVREASQTALYYRERLSGAGLAEAIVRSTVVPVAEAALLLEEPLGLRPEALDPWGALTGGDRSAAQVLAGAAAAVARRAA